MLRLHAIAGMCLIASVTAHTQVNPNQLPLRNSFDRINQAAFEARTGTPENARTLTDQILDHVSVVLIPRDHSIRKRISVAVQSFAPGRHQPIAEKNVVIAINDLARSVGAPPWAHTNADQVRLFRTALKPRLPQLVGRIPPKQRTNSPWQISDEMSPAEAVFIVFYLAKGKLELPEFQVEPKEWVNKMYTQKMERRQSGDTDVIAQEQPGLYVRQKAGHEGEKFMRMLRNDWIDERSEIARIIHSLLDRMGIAPST